MNEPSGTSGRWLTGVAAAVLLLWKFKFVLAFVAGKGKLLLFGLTKTSTLLSMFASFGVYWAAWGMWFAAGFVLSIYVHEMGHVAALRRYGIAATAPMFIPGVGAFVRVQHMPSSLQQQAYVALAGPLWGLGAAVVAYGAFIVTGNALWAAIARVGAIINVVNLVPIWQLDGSRGFAAFSLVHRWLAILIAAVVWFVTGEGLFILLFVVAIGRAFIESAPEESDFRPIALYTFLVVAFAIIAARLEGS